MTYLIVPIAIVIDRIIGEPEIFWRKIKHPVTWMAKMLMFGERYLNNRNNSKLTLRFSGLFLIIICSFICFIIATFIEFYILKLEMSGVLLALITSVFLSYKSLIDHVDDVLAHTEKGGLNEARDALSKIVGRDTRKLSQIGISRASIETLSENFSDGFVAPLFWLIIGGLPGIVTYKMINTADSMIGNKSIRFVDFGWASARIDDVANFIPARITTLIFVFATLFIKAVKTVNGIKTAFNDSKFHASPNAGWPEAAMAGFLDVRLGGPRDYINDTVKDNNWLGTGRDAKVSDIRLSLRIVNYSWFIILFLVTGANFYANT